MWEMVAIIICIATVGLGSFFSINCAKQEGYKFYTFLAATFIVLIVGSALASYTISLA